MLFLLAYHKEACQLICIADQLSCFYMICVNTESRKTKRVIDMDWVQKRFLKKEVMQNNRRKKMKKRDKKIRYHIKHFTDSEIPRRVKMKAKLLGKSAYL